MIHISASSLKDWLTCKRRHYYRITVPEEAESNIYMVMGSIVHQAVEDYWKDEEKAMEYVNEEIVKYSNYKSHIKKVNECTENFFKHFVSYLRDDDEIEKYFKIPIQDNVVLTGKMDRVTKMGLVFDWKTSTKTPSDISDDPQFIIYYEAYKKLFGKYPKGLFYASLTSGKLVEYVPSSVLTDMLFNGIIPEMIEDVKAGKFTYDGIWRYRACETCSFQKYCFSELEDRYELDSTKFTTK